MLSSRKLLLNITRHNSPTTWSFSPVLRNQLRFQSQTPKGFIPAFIESVKRQVKENKDLQKNVAQLSADTSSMMESDAMQAARKAMSKGAETGTKAAKAVGQAVQAVVENPAVKTATKVVVDVSGKVGEAAKAVADPILDTQAAKVITKNINELDQSIANAKANSRYVEYRSKQEREKLRQHRLSKQHRNPFSQRRLVSANMEAGTSVTLHKQSQWSQTWKSFTESSPIARSMLSVRRTIEESDHPIFDRLREIFSSPVFQESEQAKVVKTFQSVDPGFDLEEFTTELAEFVVPDIMEAYLMGEAEVLEEWCSERALAQLTRGFEVQVQHGLISDCKLLDLRRLELVKAMIIEDGGMEVPVLTYRFTTQEVLVFRNVKNEIVIGKEDSISTSGWVMVLTKDQCIDPTIPVNLKTGGWRVLEAVKTDSW